jgi:hypothetical protein
MVFVISTHLRFHGVTMTCPSLSRRLRVVLWLCFSLGVLGSAQLFGSSYSITAADASKLRQIGQALLIYSVDHQDRFPPAKDVWDEARFLAAYLNLDDARIWQSYTDPASASTYDKKINVLSVPIKNELEPRQLSPAFREIKPCFAVAVGRLHLNLPATTPIAWTRGLQPDGTWAAHSPYGTRGGHILFIGGNVVFYRDLKANGGELIRPDGTQTSNILEALPKGASISEYVPTQAEQVEWIKTERKTYPIHSSKFAPLQLIIFAFIWVPFGFVSVYRSYKKRAGVISIFIWPAIITVLLFILTPTVS